MEAETPELEVERLRSLLRRVYPYCLPHPGNEELLAELEREVLRIAVLENRYGPDGLVDPTRDLHTSRPAGWRASGESRAAS